MVGQKYGRWNIIGEFVLTKRKERKWLCRCDCGTERYVLERSLLYGGSDSCGCLRKEKAAEPNILYRSLKEIASCVQHTKCSLTAFLTPHPLDFSKDCADQRVPGLYRNDRKGIIKLLLRKEKKSAWKG